MRKITCDRCGAEIPKRTPPGYICIQHEVDGALAGDNPFEGWDLCENCLGEIVAFVKQKAEREKPEELARKFVQAMREQYPPETEEKEGRCLKAAPDPEQMAAERPEAEAEEDAGPEPAEPDPPPKEYKGVNLRKLRELVKAGKTAQEIAAELGCSVAMYYKHRKRAEALYNAGML